MKLYQHLNLSSTTNRSEASTSSAQSEIQPQAPAHAQPESGPAALAGLSRSPSPRGVEATAAATALSAASVTAEATAAPAHASVSATLQGLHTQLQQDKQRPVDKDLAAQLISALRPLRSSEATGAPRNLATSAELVGQVSEQDVMRWYQAQGLQESDVHTLRRTALLSGMPNPSGSFLNNAMQYIASPWINYATGNPWAGASFGFATAAIAAPMNAAQQSAVVSLCESIREHGGHVIVPDKSQINDKQWLPDLAIKLSEKLADFSKCYDDFSAAVGKHSANDAGALASDAEVVQAAQALMRAESALQKTQGDFVMTQGAHDRQWKGNRWQSIPRTLRSPLSSSLGLISKTPAIRALSPSAQAVASLVVTGMQHVAAGFDERAKQEANNTLNLLHADVFTPEGAQKLARGEPLGGQDIDEGKLRKLIQSPTQALVKRVTSGLTAVQKELSKKLENAGPASTEAGHEVDLELGHGNKPAALVELEKDLDCLREGRLTDLAHDGAAARLLAGSATSVISEQLVRDIGAKYTMREFSAQTAQRLGQAFHLGVFGSAASSVIGKLTSAAQGGTRNVPIPQVAGVAALSGAMAAVGALNQHVAISVKNNRREASPDIGLGKQITRGIMGGAQEAMAQYSGTKTSKAINAKLGDADVHTMLQKARELCQTQAAGPSNPLTLDEAVQQLRPGQRAASHSGEITVQIEEEKATPPA
ncbi:type III secretion system effector protein [Xanthomonas cerealis pv. cerealis]|uniref:Type III secretion system effector protein n=1 Tax=Xanthomonas cerealis pv. cerealis TaxID=152263 RepID=A0A514EH32_9XANT|nr:type III secretion system effector XopN [Xanthomonas translucens]QDI05352.1 type III secretion system effector protein [Xanthomonas translucens pv. cerealis]UKE69745.1 type III secretion system effector protein [Xanthomonas translucens pv. pistacia]